MSTKILNLAWDVEMLTSRKMVLIALADQANDRGECYPGIESLRRRCSMGMRTLYDALAQLEAEGWLTRENANGAGRTLYVLDVNRLAQRDLLNPANMTPANLAGVRISQGCESRSPAKSATGTPANFAAYKATKSKSNQEESGRARLDELERLTTAERQLLEPCLPFFPPAVTLATALDFVKHRGAIRRPMSISAGKQLRARLDELAAQGIDLEASLRQTMLAGLAIPVDPRPSSGGARAGPPRPRASDDFSQANYSGTSDHDLPAHLR